MKEPRFKVKKEDLLRFMEGHKKAEEIIEAETIERLQRLTPDESLREYDELFQFWEAVADKEGLENLEPLRIAFLVERRKLFDRAGGRRRNE